MRLNAASDPFGIVKGEMAERVRAFDWTQTPLGPIAGWPQSLKTAVGMVLLSPVPIVMLWGEDGIMIYNDGYSQFAGQRHPSLLGSKVREGWPEVADFNDNIMKVGLAGGTLAYRDFVLHLNRTGSFEPVWLDLDYSPILDESGRPAGVMAIVIEITERVKAQNKVRAESERLSQLFEQAPSFMAQLDGPDHIFTFANSAYQQLIGHRDVIGKTLRAALPDIEGQGFYELMDGVYSSGEGFVGRSASVKLQRTPDAPLEDRLVDFIFQPIKSADGSVTGIFVEGVDVTEQRLAEDAMRRSEERLRLATENAGVGLWDIDAEGGIDFSYSRERSSFVMAQNERVPIENLLSQLHPEDASRLRAAYDAARDPQKRALMDVEYRVLPTEDTSLRWIKVRGRAQFDKGGQCVRLNGTALDITKERETQEALARSEEQLRLAAEHAEIGLWDVDNIAGSLYWSEVREAFGITHEGPVSLEHDFFPGLHPDDRERTAAANADANDPQKRALYDVENRTIGQEDGIERWVHAKGRGVFDESGTCLRVLGTAVDITSLKRSQVREAVLVELGDRLRELEDPDDLAFAAAEILGRALNVSRVGYGTIDPRNETIYIARDWNAPGIKSLAGTLHFRDYGSYIEDLKRGDTVVYSDARLDPRTASTAEALDGIDARARVNMPVTEQGGFRGAALPQQCHRTRMARCRSGVDPRSRRTHAHRGGAAHRGGPALRSSEEQRLATEYADVGLWDVDIVNDKLYWPERVNRMFGFAPDARVTMKQFRAAIHPDDRRRVIGAILDACDAAKRTPYDIEYRIVRKDDGAVRWMAAKGRAIFDDADMCVRMLGIILDVTERKAVEEQARESEARFRTLFESIDDGFCIIEAIAAPDGVIADFRYIEENPALARRSGVVGVLGHTIREMLPTEADGWIDILAVLVTGEPLRFERFLETTGRLLELYVLRVEPRGRGQVAVLFQDITDRRAAELRLHELNETLEQRVAERTAALERSQAALQQAQKMEAIGNLTGGIAHDFNNLLQGLTGSLDLIRRKPENTERVRHWAEAGLQAAERGAKLTAQLLAFSRAQKLELKPLDLSALLEGIRDLLGRTLGPSVRVVLDLASGEESVLGDETQLEMSVLNLAINARDAMPKGGVLTISTARRALAQDWAERIWRGAGRLCGA